MSCCLSFLFICYKERERDILIVMVGGLPSSKLWEIEYNELIFKEVIGKGNFGCVYRGLYLSTEVAIKQIEPTLFEDPDYAKYIEREVKALRYIRHNGIVYFYGACHHSTGFYLVTEFVDGMDLRRYIKTFVSSPPSWSTRISLMLDLAKTCYFLHSKGILHRDLKSKNILLYLQPDCKIQQHQNNYQQQNNISQSNNQNNSNNQNINYSIKSSKLCDLGFVRIGSQYSNGEDSSSSEEEEDDDDEDEEEDNDTKSSVYKFNGNGKMAKNRLRRMSICGTPSFMPPEILLQKRYDWTADVFSFGVVLAEIVTRRRPGKDLWVRSSENGFDISKEELVTGQDFDCPPSLFDLCLKCCSYRSIDRPKFSDIVFILENLLQQQIDQEELQPNSNNVNNLIGQNQIIIEPICYFKQSLKSNYRKSIRLRSESISNHSPIQQQQEGILKISKTKYLNGWKDFGLDISKLDQIWIIYYLNEKIEMTIGKIKSTSGKNSLTISYMDNNLIDNVSIINVKSYKEQFPHTIDTTYIHSHSSFTISKTFGNMTISTVDKILWHKNVDLLIQIQSNIRKWIVQSKYQQLLKNWKQDNNNNNNIVQQTSSTIKEWMTTIDQFIQSEKDYKERLDFIVKGYLVPLQSKFRINKPLLNYKEITAIFSNIETIIEISNNLLSTFQPINQELKNTTTYQQQQSSPSTSQSLSTIDFIFNNNNRNFQFLNYFIQHFENIKSIYGKYTYNFKFAMNILVWCRGNPDFSRFLAQSNTLGGDEEFDLAALLALPVNRIQTYNLHLLTLTRLVPVKHPDYKDIMAAHTLITNLSSFLQSQLEMSLNYSSIMSTEIMLQSSSNSKKEQITLLASGRSIIRQGLVEQSRYNNNNVNGSSSSLSASPSPSLYNSSGNVGGGKKKYQLILMTDLIILAKPILSKCSNSNSKPSSLSSSSTSNTKYYLKEKMVLNLRIDQVNLKLSGDHPCGIILTFGVNGSKSYRFLAPTDDDAYHWASDFVRTIHSTNPISIDESNNSNNNNSNNSGIIDQQLEKSPSFIQRFRPRSTSIQSTPDKRSTVGTDPSGIFKVPDTPPSSLSSSFNTPGSEKKKFSTLVKSKWKRIKSRGIQDDDLI
ncbi:LISK family protein kinase [Cavenderia fasciculata]|uniref:non-specific serine/threonine protein kinase n=1 Tax=Cavenderia fasciculata TaxID=261658 RepID=F4Q7F7_CACFS|nr:LISK family protein kinase [Cavenderia fasciculata]EGG16339.1 LISK family protein kinase [Cavenderia fasciculata]|eukprot:XP_004354723.1 LISK family protein kinase [Cavenderia fasciculata]